MARTRAELMEEIGRIDAKINELITQLPTPPRAQVVPFPWGFWLLAILFVGAYLYDQGALLGAVHPQLYAYRLIILVVGLLIGLMALVYTIRSLSHLGGGGGRYKHLNKRLEQLRRERAILARQLNEMGRT